jgi:DtxR family Mn-dependent transcriptional regulator
MAYNHAAAMITISKEDYLKAIFEAESEGKAVISATLANWLKVSPPAVTMALRRLKRDRLVKVGENGRVHLTGEGRRIAERLAVRHLLIERMLTEIFGMAWYRTHDEAERLEHAVSAEFETLLANKLGHDQPCPHGNFATGDSPAHKRKRGLRLLAEVDSGHRYTVASVYEWDSKLGALLDQRGLRPGSEFFLRERTYDQTLSLDTPTGPVVLGHPAAEKIWVSPVAPSASNSTVNYS